MPRNPKVSIIIVYYKEKKEILNCLESIKKSKTKVPFEVIVVDNAREKHAKRDLSKYKWVNYIKSPGNIGFGAGNNLGAKNALGEYILILNPDTLVMPGAIDKLYQFIEKREKVAIAAPVLLDAEKKIYPFQGNNKLTPLSAIFSLSFINKYFPNNPISKKYWLKEWDKKSNKQVDIVPGTAFMVRKNIFQDINGFDENFFLYFEEFDLCKRIKELGWKIFMVSNAKIVHFWGKGTEKIKKPKLDKIFRQSRFYYFKKHFGLLNGSLVELFANLNYEVLLFLIIIAISILIRFYKIEDSMAFGGEHGQNYLQLKEYYEAGKIPLKGPPTGRSWLWLGPLFYWIMLPFFIIFNFNPVVPAYFFAILSLTLALINFQFVKRWFGEFSAKISTIFVLLGPMWLIMARQSRFFFLTPFFSYFYFYFLISGLKGNKEHIYWSFLFLGIMINFHYSVLILIPSLVVFLFLRWKELNLSKLKALFYFLLPNVPFIIVNIRERFIPLVNTAIWIPYRVAGFLGLISKNNLTNEVFYKNVKSLLFMFGSHFYFRETNISLLLGASFTVYSLILLKNALVRKIVDEKFIIIVTFWLGYAALFIHGSPPYHYWVPLIFVFPLIISLFLENLSKNYQWLGNKILLTIMLLILALFNYQYLLSSNWFKKKYEYKNDQITYNLQKLISEAIIKDVRSNYFSLKRVGAFDYYEGNFAQNYQYLLWWMGNKPKQYSDIVYTIYEGEYRFLENKEEDVILRKYGVVVTKKQI